MVARPGRQQAAFTAGEISALLNDRTELRFFSTGMAHAENVEIMPQGGFQLRDGLRDIGALQSDAARLFPFNSSDGSAYDVVIRPAQFEAWDATTKLQTVTISNLTSAMLAELTFAQQLDTMAIFHPDFEPGRISHLAPTNWVADTLPLTNVPTYDYGGPIGGGSYTNGVAAEWQLEFNGLVDATTVFTLEVSNEVTVGITYSSTMATLVSRIDAAILALPNVATGIAVTSPSTDKIKIVFSGTDNIANGDGWAVTGLVVNKTDAAILANKTVAGVRPGEAIISSDRGWPSCGTFFNQRLLIGGFKALPNAWMFSVLADYFNFDESFSSADGSALVPMDAVGGEAINQIAANRNLLIFTSKAEYWIDERALSKTEAPNHVQSSTNGSKRGVPVVQSEGAAIFCHANGGVLGEFRYADVEGNFTATNISLLAPHLVANIIDLAQRRATVSTDGNHLVTVASDGVARLVTLLREQEVIAFTRITSAGALFKAVSVNGRNEVSFITERPAGRRLERFESGLLLDEAVDFSFGTPSDTLTGLARFDGRVVWAIGDRHVFGPFTVAAGTIILPLAVSAATVGTWQPPVVKTLPPSRSIGPKLVLKRKGRIPSVRLSLEDTTSVAVSVNGKALKEIDLVRFGALADVAELDQGLTGEVVLRGIAGFADEPYLTISQLRPGRLTVRSITLEAAL
jgi:hypothetical protein